MKDLKETLDSAHEREKQFILREQQSVIREHESRDRERQNRKIIAGLQLELQGKDPRPTLRFARRKVKTLKLGLERKKSS